MYSDKELNETLYTAGQNPLECCPYYDGIGYSKQHNKTYDNLFVQGGVRRRVFSFKEPATAPALNKVPLVKWKLGYFYISSMHMLLQHHLNRSFEPHHTTGVLLHFKFISQLSAKVEQELNEKQHYNDSVEYKQYHTVIKQGDVLYDERISVTYTGWLDLAKRGLINLGDW